MKKFFLTSFLPLCILLLSGCSQLHAHANRDIIHDSSSKLSERSGLANIEIDESALSFVKTVSAFTRDKSSIGDATEVREGEEKVHELVPFKKSRENISYFSAIFCALTRGYFFTYTREILSFHKHFSDVPPNRRHLILQVFLI